MWIFQLLYFHIGIFQLHCHFPYLFVPHPLLIKIGFFFTISFAACFFEYHCCYSLDFLILLSFSFLINFTNNYWTSFDHPCEHGFINQKDLLWQFEWTVDVWAENSSVFVVLYNFACHINICLSWQGWLFVWFTYLIYTCYSILRICLQHNYVYWYVLKEMISSQNPDFRLYFLYGIEFK